MKRNKVEKLKRELFDVLAYIVEGSINDNDIDKIIDTQIIPIFKRYVGWGIGCRDGLGKDIEK